MTENSFDIIKFKMLLSDMIQTKIPDLHFSSKHAPYLRDLNGDIAYLENFWELSKNNIQEIIIEMIWPEGWKVFLQKLELDFSYSHDGFRFRVNIYNDSRGYSIAIRYIPNDLPTLEMLGLGAPIKNLLKKQKGLILVTGPTGSGKSTTLAAMINYMNQTFKRHIITIEDPIEFNFQNDKCLVNQRELGTHTTSFAKAMKSALREDPDIIMVWEMRDPETISAALTLAETGHLVLSTLHTNDTVQSIDRIIDSFHPSQQNQIRAQLSMTLSAVVSQILLPKKDGKGRVAAREVLINTDAVRSLIQQGLTHQLYSIIELSGQDNMVLMDKCLEDYYHKKMIDKDVFASHVRDKDLVNGL